MYKISKLDQDAVAQIRALEEELGCQIMAMEPGPEMAELSEEQVAKVQALEESLGNTLLVYKA